LVADSIEVPVQINGKLRGRVTVPSDVQPDALETAAKEEIAELLEGKTIRKAIVVPGRMVNLVVG
jgi:leucyl-tRNA synthetase